MKYGYIIGPFRAPTTWEVEQNVRNAETLGFEVAKLDAFPVIPHANTRFFNGLLDDKFWIEGTSGLLLRCDFAITVEAIGRSWKQSVGSCGEVALAVFHNKPVFHHLLDLKYWIERQRLQ
jgi:hypothetical protein